MQRTRYNAWGEISPSKLMLNRNIQSILRCYTETQDWFREVTQPPWNTQFNRFEHF